MVSLLYLNLFANEHIKLILLYYINNKNLQLAQDSVNNILHTLENSTSTYIYNPLSWPTPWSHVNNTHFYTANIFSR